MKTKICLLAMAATAITLTCKAQNKTSLGITAGINFHTINGQYPRGEYLGYTLKTGFTGGVNVQIPIAAQLYLQPGVLFSIKGAKDKIPNSRDHRYNISYLEFPVNLIYKHLVGKGKLIVGGGPYAALGLGGKAHFYYSGGYYYLDIKFKNKVSSGEIRNYYLPMKRLDVGGNILIGYELSSKISAQVNGQLGLIKINPKITDYPEDKTVYRNAGFSFSVGYRL